MNIKEFADKFVEYTETLSRCAYTDAMVLNIIYFAEKLKDAYYQNTP